MRRGRAARTRGRRAPSRSARPTTRCCCPGWSTPTCTSTSPAAPSGRASRSATRAAAAGRRHHARRHAAELDPADRRRRRARRPSARPRPASATSTSASGAARCRPASAASARCATRASSGSSASSSTAACRSSRRSTRAELDRALAEVAALDALLIVHAEDAGVLGRGAGVRRAVVRPASWARARTRPRTSAIARAARPGRAAPAPGCTCCTCPAPPPCRRSRRPAPPGVRVTVETCPHYLTLSAEEVPDGAHRVQVLPADPRRRQPRRAVGGAGRRDRSTASCPTTRPRPPDLKHLDTGDFARGLGRGRLAAARAAAGLDRRAGPAGSALATWCGWMSTAPAALVGLARKGAIAPGRDADLVVVRTRGDVRGRPGAAAPPQPRHAVRRPRARRRGARRVAARAAASSTPGRSPPSPPADCCRREPT